MNVRTRLLLPLFSASVSAALTLAKKLSDLCIDFLESKGFFANGFGFAPLVPGFFLAKD